MRPDLALKSRKMVSTILLFALLGSVSLLITQSQNRQTTQTDAAGDCTVSTEQMEIKPQEQNMVDLVNAYRTEKGLQTLTWSPALKRPAAWMSNDMVDTQNLNHTDSLGRVPATRLPDCGFPITTTYAENIAQGSQNPQDVLTAWKASDPHNQILINPNYRNIGVAMEIDQGAGTGIAYWTMDVAGVIPSVSPSPSASVSPSPSTNVTPGLSPEPSGPSSGDPTPTLGPATVDMQLSVKVKVTGIGSDGNKNPKNRTRKIIATTFDSTNKQVTTGTAFLTYDGADYFSGIIRLGRMTEGVYFVRLIGDGTLSALVQPEFQLLKATQVNTLPPVALLQGDVNRDNTLSIADFNEALACFQNKRCESQEIIDFNDDGTTDVTDYNLLLRSFTTLRGN